MSDKRYAPPAATVADVESGAESLERPQSVTVGVSLLWAEIVLGIPGLVYGFIQLGKDPDESGYWVQVGSLVAQVAFIALAVLLTHMSWKGRNWARITNLVLLIVGLVTWVAGYAISYATFNSVPDWISASWEGAVFVLQTLLDVAGVWLLFTATSNAWFRAVRAARTEGHFSG